MHGIIRNRTSSKLIIVAKPSEDQSTQKALAQKKSKLEPVTLQHRHQYKNRKYHQTGDTCGFTT